MVRHDEEMFKVHPEDECRDDPAVTDMRNRGYWVKEVPDQSRVHLERERHPDTNTGLILHHYPPSTDAVSFCMSIDAKLDKIIDLLGDIKRMLK